MLGLKAKERLAGLLRAGPVDVDRDGTATTAPSPACLLVVLMSDRSSWVKGSPFLGGMDRKLERPGCGIGAERYDTPCPQPAPGL